MAANFFHLFTLDHTKANSDQTNFPVVISGTFSWAATVANGGKTQNASGFDVRPFAGVPLTTARTFQLRNYNATTGALNMVVLQPTYSASVDGTIAMSNGDSTISTDGSSTSVWDANFKGVFSMGDGSSLSLADSTSNANTLSNQASATAASGPTAGMGAVSLDGSTQYLFKNAAIVAGDPISFECIFNPTSAATTGGLVSQDRDIATLANGQQLSKLSTGVCRVLEDGATTASTANSYTASAWNYLVGMFTDTTNRSIRLNSGTKASVAAAGSATTTNNFLIGARRPGTASNFMGGLIGETRVSSLIRADDWYALTDNNLRATIFTVGPEGSVNGLDEGGDFIGTPLPADLSVVSLW